MNPRIEKALVVDDQVEFLTVAAEIFDRLGYQVFTADTGAEALAVLAKNRDMSVVFTDVVMPGMSGLELAHRASRLFPNLHVVLTSGILANLAIPEDWSFVAKPVQSSELVKVLRSPRPDRGRSHPVRD
jgi:CheY-like chemotaxis protein